MSEKQADREREARIRERRDPLWFQISSLADWIESEFPDKGWRECLGPADVKALRKAKRELRRVERYREALEHTTRELEHWLEWKNGKAMTPQREKGRAALGAAHRALNDGEDDG